MPATPNTLASLLVQQDQATILAAALQIAQSLNLPVTSWQPGDPTRSLLMLEAQILEALELEVVGYIQSGFLDYAQGQWLYVLAQEVYNIIVPGPTFATTQVTLTNTSGAFYSFNPGDLKFQNPTSNATYTNTTGGTLTGPGGTLSVTVVADVAGSASSAGAGQINTLVTSVLGVTCTNPAAATGTDSPSPATIVQQCRNKLGSLSPNGPAAAYSFVALNSALTGITTPTRVRTYPSSQTGNVQIFVASASGALAGSDVTAVQNAINTYATPLCITPTVSSANPVIIPVTYTIWLYNSVNQTVAQIQAAIQTALQNFFAARPIGGDIIPPATTGSLYQSMITEAIGAVFPTKTFRVSVTAPAGDTALNNGDVPELGVITSTVNLITDPF